MVIGGVAILTSILLVPLFARIRKQIGLMIVIQLLSAVIVFYTFRANDFIKVVYSVFMIYILLKAVFTPLEQNYISLHAKEGEYGRAMGTRQSFISIGFVIGPLVGGFLYEKNPTWLFDASAISFLIGFGILILISFLNRRDLLASKGL
jgi:DHA1 family multidrug resistance protein-like MFS transporter